MFARTPVVYTKMKTRKNRERKETLAEEIPPPKEKLTKKRAKKVATPTSKKSSSIPQFPGTLPKLGKDAVTAKERKGGPRRAQIRTTRGAASAY
jgi:hypothetical protein